jgi:hypothetical protein
MRRIAFSMVMLLSLVAVAFAQSNTGNLVVNVSDASGVIPGATVTITDNQTGRERNFVTSGDGGVSISQLEVGTYTVKVSATGRQTKIYRDVKVDIAQTYGLNVVLDAGDIQEVVEVSAGTDLINNQSGEISRTISGREIVDLPLNGRNPLSLISLQAGTSSNGATNTVINGQRSSFTNITRDGLNVQDNFIRSNATDFIPDRPNTDDVGEFTITNQNAGVELGYGASQISLVTPRGSNKFSGAAYVYNRNSKFSANSFEANRTGVKLPFLNRNQFGGRLGGPIWKNRVFFYGAYEGFRQRQQVSASRTTLLPDAKNGIFKYLDGTSTLQSINLLSAANQNVIGSAVTSIDSAMTSRILSKLPVGNNPLAGDGRNTIGYNFNRRQNQDREAVTLRFDSDVNSKHSLSTVYSYRKEILDRPDVDAIGGAGFTAIPSSFQDAYTYTTNSAWRWTPMANLTNEVRIALQLNRPQFGNSDTQPGFFLSVPVVSNPEVNFQRQGRNTATWTFQDNAVWTVGDHSLRMGLNITWYRAAPYGPGAFSGSNIPTVTVGTGTTTTTMNPAAFTGGITTAQLGTANGLLALLGGIVPSAGQTFYANGPSGFQAGAFPQRRLHFEHYAGYIGDQWRVRPDLTINAGVRWDYFTPISEPDAKALEPVIGANSSILTAIMNPVGTYNFVGTNNGDNRFFKPDKNNFAPNISFAWSPEMKGFLGRLLPGGGKAVIRGGLSWSYVNDEFVRAADNALAGNAGLTQGVSAPGLNLRVSSFVNPIATPAFQIPRTYAQNNALAANFGTVFAIDPDLQIPSLMQWNIGYQREIGWRTAIEFRYVGNASNNLVRGVDFNELKIIENGWLADFNRARANMAVSGGAAGNPVCTTTGCVALTLLNNTTIFGPNAAAFMANATVRSNIWAGNVADLATLYISNPTVWSASGSSNFFLPNPGTGVVDLMNNSARSTYNSFQFEVRRRFSDGLYFQANYSLAKTLTDAPGTGQTRFEPLLKNDLRANEYVRADFNTEHVFNANAIYELPIGKGKRFLNQGGVVDYIFGGWQMTSIFRMSSGAPIKFLDARGTLNRAGRSGRQTANSSLTNPEISNMIGVYRTPCGVYWLPTTVININQSNLNAGLCSSLGSGRGAEGFGTTPFAGQVFFNVAPGFTGNMSLNAWNGPTYLNWDASMMKNFRIREGMRVQVRAEAFNVLNKTNFYTGGGSITATSFGRITSTFANRVMQGVIRFEF